MGFLDKIISINDFSPDDYVPFVVGGTSAGLIRRGHEAHLLRYADVFTQGPVGEIVMNPALDTFEARSEAIAPVVEALDAANLFAFSCKDEMFPVITGWGAPPLMQIDRGATIFFGVPVFGLHVNGYTWRDGKMYMWLGRRGYALNGWPGMYDQMVAGGQPIGLGLTENLIKEGGEEAGFAPEIMGRARAAGTVSYTQNLAEGVRRDTLFLYDLELPSDVEPKADGKEVAEFLCLPVENVAEIVRDRNEFKTNCHLVVIDFLVRHGFLTAENEPDYIEIIRRLRSL